VLARFCTARVLLEHNAYAAGLVGADRPDEERNWIDRATPDEATVGMVPSPVNARGGQPVSAGEVDQAVWWDPEYWNKRVDRVFQLLDGQTYTPFPRLALTIDSETGALRPSSGTMPTHLLLARSDVRFAPRAQGRVVSSGDLVLYALAGKPRAAWAVDRVASAGYFDRSRGAELTLYPATGSGAVAHEVTLLLDRGAGDPGAYKVSGPGLDVSGRMGSSRAVTFTACVPAARSWSARIDLPGAATPRLAEVTDVPGGACSASGDDGR
jgi:hypothetical protein